MENSSILIHFFTWTRNDEMDEASGWGEAEIEENRTLTITLRFHLGGEAQLKATKLWLFSNPFTG